MSEMTEEQALAALSGSCYYASIDGRGGGGSEPYIFRSDDMTTVALDGSFTATELRAFLFFLERNPA